MILNNNIYQIEYEYNTMHECVYEKDHKAVKTINKSMIIQ